MVVGYSLGNRSDQEEDVDVLTEDNDNIITYSKTLPLCFTHVCNSCPNCGYNRKDGLMVPYSSIKPCKNARKIGVREAFFVSGERPADQFPHIRATLDLWGFTSYLEYLYTVCELSFLEGLVPVLEVGFLTPDEIKRLSEVCAMIRIVINPAMLDEKSLNVKMKSIEWCSKLKVPVAIGFMVGFGETMSFRKDVLHQIAKYQKEHGMIHEFIIQNYVDTPEIDNSPQQAISKKGMLSITELALSILPSDTSVVVPIETNPDIADFIRLGIRDLGRITYDSMFVFSNRFEIDLPQLHRQLETLGFSLKQRFPLRKSFIKEGKYSKKLGQVFDAYRYKIKKGAVEKLKEVKESDNG
tara:strand:+ start:97 stop:1158 length:1062 start_codon:yes stop_codon:yes gene_type:complete